MKKVRFSKSTLSPAVQGAASPADAVAKVLQALAPPINESQKRLPEAGKYLGRISAETETAARKMLEKVEQIIACQDEITSLMDGLVQSLETSPDNGKEECVDRLTRIRKMIGNVQSNAFSVMETLQFQDVTSQYVQETSILLSDVEQYLRRLHIIVAKTACRESDTEGEREPVAVHVDNQQDVDALVMRTVKKPG
jgi:chemotaxis regulatin CheY-phosphate phosphatase CheZ